MGNFCKGLNVIRARLVDDDGNNFDVCFKVALGFKVYSKRLVDVVDMIYRFLYICIGGVLALNDLFLSSVLLCGVFDKSPFRIKSVSDCMN